MSNQLNVLVVGGGDSALEAAARIAEQPGTEVTLSYRGTAYGRARARNRDRVRELADEGRLAELLESQVTEIRKESIVLAWRGEQRELANDSVIICAGGLLPTQFLHETGIQVETKFGTV